MKSKSFLLLSALLSLAIPQVANAQALSGTFLNIGSNTYSATNSATNSGVIGLNNSTSSTGSGSLVIGQSNHNSSPNTLIVGKSNSSYPVRNEGASSAIFGEFNYVLPSNSLVAGSNNQLLSYSSLTGFGLVRNSALLGSGLISQNDNCVVVGKNNAGIVRVEGPTAPVFVVANGVSTSARSNALEVRANGDIIITKAQGDISMGIYQ